MTQTMNWKEHADAMGLLEHQCYGENVQMLFNNLDDLRDWTNKSVQNTADAKSPLTAKDIDSISEPEIRKAVEKHVMGVEELSPEVVSAINNRVKTFVAFAAAAPNITVTGSSPLIISNSGVNTHYGTVTIKDGGYIEITATCSFLCDALIKEAGGTAPGREADIVIHATDGGVGAAGANGHPGTNGKNGGNAECDCCGGTVAHSATAGGPGTDGGDASPGNQGGNGGWPITVNMSLGKITGSVTLLSRGANGGKGGDGGQGGQGGNGGKGGDGRTCGAYHPSGKNGGAAGNGGNGGNNGSGGNATNGGTVTVTFDEAGTGSGGSLTPQNSGGTGGAKGSVGQAGSAGTPGAGGSHGGTSGSGGTQGQPGNDVATAGQNSSKGTLTVNGKNI